MAESPTRSTRSLREVLARLGVRPSKRRGQTFLVNPATAERIVGFASPGPRDLVFEIGPGLGALTSALVASAGYVIAVESDSRLASWLRVNYGGNENWELVEGDVLGVDLEELAVSGLRRLGPDGGAVKVVSNIPYSISAPLIAKLLDELRMAECLVLTVQNELAQRITARPGGKDYGSFSIFCQYQADVSRVMRISPGAFYPVPEVTSAVVVMRPGRRGPAVTGETESYFSFIRGLFSYRRKMIGTIIRGMAAGRLDREDTSRLISSLGIDPSSRPERISPGQLELLYNTLVKKRLLSNNQ